MSKVRVLFLAADPAGTRPLRLDEELRRITDKIRSSEYRGSIELVSRWAVRPDDLVRALLEVTPHVVHFSGHSSSAQELILLDDLGNPKPVSKAALASLFRTLKDNVRVVVLDACDSRPQAEALAETIDCTVGMNRPIGDEAAVVFAASFYRAVASGRSVKEAFELGKAALLLEGIPEDQTPELRARTGVDLAELRLITPPAEGPGAQGLAQPVGVPGRLALVRELSNLAPADLAMLLTGIPGANRHVSRHGTVPEHVAELVRWAESSHGPGLAAVEEVARELRPHSSVGPSPPGGTWAVGQSLRDVLSLQGSAEHRGARGASSISLPSRTYDVFLSYHPRDYPVVERLGRWLEEHGLSCFMDRWYLVPDTAWPSALDQAMSQSKTVAVFLGPGEMGRWQRRVLSPALAHRADSGQRTVAVLLPGADPPLGLLTLPSWVDLRTRPDDRHLLSVLTGAARGLTPAELEPDGLANVPAVCPFRGLLPYREEDAPFFFGRQDDTDRLAAAVNTHPFVAVLGASGSGKSSVVQAGLVPRLRADPKTVWDVVTLVPTARPLHSLVNAFAPLLWPDLDDEVERREKANEKTASLEKGTLSLRDFTEIALRNQQGTQRLLLVVDQWEELYTLCRDEKLIHAFTDQLLDASQSVPVSVIFTCRADFYGRVLGYRPLVDRIQETAQVSLGPMDEKELRQVIEEPAAKVGLEFEPGLSQRILTAMGQEPGRLPLLSFLLEQLWNRRRGTVLTNEAYDAIGGVEGAVASVAEDVFKNLPGHDQERLPRVFIQLVSVGEESEDTRRRAPMTTLGEEARSLIEGLVKARLLVKSSEQGVESVEVAHEALIRHWNQSKTWVNNARGFLTWRKRLEPFVDEWQKRDRDRSALLRGGLLAEAERWLRERPQDLDAPEREFIEDGIRQQEGETQAEARRKRFLVGLATAAVAAAILATGLGGVAFWQKGVADGNAVKARANEVKALRNLTVSMAAQSAVVRGAFPVKGVLIAAEAIDLCRRSNIQPAVSVEQSLRDSLQNIGGLGLGGQVTALAVSPDGRWLATACEDATARLWDLKADEPGKTVHALSGLTRKVTALAVSPGGRWLAAVCEDATARLWDLETDEPEKTARVLCRDPLLPDLTVSPDGRWLVARGPAAALVWDLAADAPEKTARTFSGNWGGITAMTITPKTRWLATGGGRGTVLLWDLKADEPEKTVRTLSGNSAAVTALAVSPNGRWLVTCGRFDATALVWDLEADAPEKTARTLSGHTGKVTALAVSPGGRWLAIAGDDATARLWDLNADEPGKPARVLRGSRSFSDLAVSPDGRWLAAGSNGTTAWLWDLKADESEKPPRDLKGHTNPVTGLSISPDGRWLITRGRDEGTVLLWDLGLNSIMQCPPRVLRGHDGKVETLAVSPDGRWLVTGGADATARLWDLTSEPERTAQVLCGQADPVAASAVSSDGRWLATGGRDGTVRLWDLTADDPRRPARVLSGHAEPVTALAISPDGRWIAANGEDRTAQLWDLADEPVRPAHVLSGHTGKVDSLSFEPGNRWLATGVRFDGTARLWNLRDPEPGSTARVLSDHRDMYTVLSFSPDGRWLTISDHSGRSGGARLWDLTSPEPEKTIRVLKGEPYNEDVRALAASSDGRWLATGGRTDKTVRLWGLSDRRSPRPVRTLEGHAGVVTALRFSPDGRWLASGSHDDEAVRLWDLSVSAPKTPSRVLRGHAGDRRVLAFSLDGRWLATSSRVANAGFLWDMTAPEPEKTARALRGHAEGGAALAWRREGWAANLAFSRDARWVVAEHDGVVELWPSRIEDLLKQATRAAGRTLTRQELDELFPGEDSQHASGRHPDPRPARPQP